MHLSQYPLVAALALAGCASQPPGTRPDDMSAFDHHRAATMHRQRAAELQARFDPSAWRTKVSGSHSTDFDDSGRRYNPTSKFLDESKEERSIARKHEAAAHVLEQSENRQCGPIPADDRRSCPLMHGVVREQDVPGGAKLMLAPEMSASALAAHMRCHHSFGRAHAFEGMLGCPLYLKDVDIDVSEGGHFVTITSDDPATVQQIRTRTHVPSGALTHSDAPRSNDRPAAIRE